MQDNNPGKFIAVQLLAEHTTDPGDTPDYPQKNGCWVSHICGALWMRIQNSGICISTDLFPKHSISCTHFLPHFSAFPTQALDLQMKLEVQMKKARKGWKGMGWRNESGKERWQERAGPHTTFSAYTQMGTLHWHLCARNWEKKQKHIVHISFSPPSSQDGCIVVIILASSMLWKCVRYWHILRVLWHF